MPRTSAALVLSFVFAACSGGGGGGSTPKGGAIVDFGATAIAATGGEVIAVASPGALLVVGTDYTVQWSAGGVSAGTSRARAVGATTLAVQVPFLPAGGYLADVLLEGATGRVRLDLAAAAIVANPAAYLVNTRDQLLAVAAARRTEASADPDPTRRAARLADLTQADQWIAAFDAARQSASPADAQAFATMLDASDELRSTMGVPAFDEEARLLGVAGDVALARRAGLAGLAAVGFARTGQPSLVASTGLVAHGLLAIAAALPIERAAVVRPWKPVEALVLEPASTASGTLVQPTLQLTVGTPLAITARANFGSLATQDRAATDPVVLAAVADIDALVAAFAGVEPAIAALVTVRPAPLPTERTIERDTLVADRLSIEAQGNPAVTLQFAGGALRALAGSTAPASTIALFRYESGSYGALTQAVTVQVAAP